MKSLVRTSLFFLFTLLTTYTHAATHTGKVIAITDGDTIKILTSDKRQIKMEPGQIRRQWEKENDPPSTHEMRSRML